MRGKRYCVLQKKVVKSKTLFQLKLTFWLVKTIPPVSSKRGVSKEAIISQRRLQSAHRRQILKWTLHDLLLSEVIRIKMNFALFSWQLSWISMWHNIRNFNKSLFSFTTLLMVQNLQTVLIFKLLLGTSFACTKVIRALVYTDLLLMIGC